MAKMRLIVFKGFSSFAESLFLCKKMPSSQHSTQAGYKKAPPGGEALNMC